MRASAPPARPLKGTVIILPGRNECIEKYFETIRDLGARGLGSAIVDWRGQGDSGRMLRDPARGYVDNFYDYVRDLEQFFEEVVLPDCRGPFYMLGHSTGSLVALLAAPSHDQPRAPHGAVRDRCCRWPAFPFRCRPSAALASALYAIGLGSMYMAGGARPRETKPFSTNVLTTDHDRYRRNSLLYETYPQLALGGPTVAWVRAACIAADTVQDPDFIAQDADPDAVRRRRLRRGRLDAGDRTLCAPDQVGLAAHHRRRAPRDLAGGGHLSRAVARRLRRLRSRQ